MDSIYVNFAVMLILTTGLFKTKKVNKADEKLAGIVHSFTNLIFCKLDRYFK